MERGTCFPEPVAEKRVLNASSLSSMVLSLVSARAAVLLVRDRTTSNMLFHLDAFPIQMAADDFVCAFDLFLCASSACRMSTLSPCTSLSSSRVLGSRSLSVCSRVLGSRSLAVFLLGFWVPFPGCFLFFSSSFN